MTRATSTPMIAVSARPTPRATTFGAVYLSHGVPPVLADLVGACHAPIAGGRGGGPPLEVLRGPGQPPPPRRSALRVAVAMTAQVRDPPRGLPLVSVGGRFAPGGAPGGSVTRVAREPRGRQWPIVALAEIRRRRLRSAVGLRVPCRRRTPAARLAAVGRQSARGRRRGRSRVLVGRAIRSHVKGA
jgi:hypothetical protein